jgi:thioredoxin reductase
MSIRSAYEVVIIGGSYAGLSAAMALGRALRNVLVIDGGKPCNRQTPHSHNFITQDGETPAAIAAKAKQQVMKYDTVHFLDASVTDIKKQENLFTITTNDGKQFTAQKILFATGIRDIMPEIPGFAECWGISVLHCPYCHGYEVRGQKTAIIANGDMAYHIGALITNWTKDLTLLTNGKSTLTKEQTDDLQKRNVSIIETSISDLVHKDGMVESVNFADGTSIQVNAIYSKPPFEQHSHLPQQLGCQLNEQGYIQVDIKQKTTADGIYAAGDNTSMMRAVAAAVAGGNMAGAAINAELIFE